MIIIFDMDARNPKKPEEHKQILMRVGEEMKTVTVSILPKENACLLPKSVVPAFYDIVSNELTLQPNNP